MEALLTPIVLLLLILVIVAFVRISTLSAKLDDALFDIRFLKAGAGGSETHAAPAPPEPPAKPPRAETVETPARAPVPVAAPALEPRPAPATPSARPPSRTKEEWESLIGGKLLNRIGALALIIGTGFFLKYAFDRDWITESMRVLIGGILGGALLLGAARTHRRGFQIFAQGLVGAGIAILYLSVYASFNFYALVTQPVAFVLMGLVTIVTFLQAFKYDSFAVSLLGWLGGFLTPFMLSTGETNVAGLFTYIALLDAGVLAMLLLKPRWMLLEPLTLAGTFWLYFLWHAGSYSEQHFSAALFFVCVFWFLFHAMAIARDTFEPDRTTLLQRLIAGANGILTFIALYLVVDPEHHEWMGTVTAALGILYTASAIFVYRRTSGKGTTHVQYSISAIVFAVIAAEIQWEGFTVIRVYALEAITLAWIGISWRVSAARIAAPVVLYWGLFMLLATRGALVTPEPELFRLLINPRTGAFLSLIVATAALVLMSGRTGGTPSRLRPVLHGTWVALVFALLTAEISDYFRWLLAGAEEPEFATLRFHRSLMMVAVWTMYAVPLTLAGFTLRLKQLLYAGIGMIALAVIVGSSVASPFIPLADFRPVVNIRFLTLGGIAGIALWQAVWLRKHSPPAVGEWVHLAWTFVTFILFTAETIDMFRQLGIGAAEAAKEEYLFMRLMTLGGVWTLISIPMVWRGALTSNRLVFVVGLVIAVLGTCTATVRGLAYDPVTAFQPILNIRAGILLGTIATLLLYVNLLHRSAPFPSWRPEFSMAARLMAIVATLALLTGEIRDSYESAIAILPFDGADEAHRLENMKQLILSSAWLVYSVLLMGYGIWRRMRFTRVSSIVIFGLAILKIFIYDLSFLDTLYRIFSFIGLGVILLAVSYLYQRFRDKIFGSA